MTEYINVKMYPVYDLCRTNTIYRYQLESSVTATSTDKERNSKSGAFSGTY